MSEETSKTSDKEPAKKAAPKTTAKKPAAKAATAKKAPAKKAATTRKTSKAAPKKPAASKTTTKSTAKKTTSRKAPAKKPAAKAAAAKTPKPEPKVSSIADEQERISEAADKPESTDTAARAGDDNGFDAEEFKEAIKRKDWGSHFSRLLFVVLYSAIGFIAVQAIIVLALAQLVLIVLNDSQNDTVRSAMTILGRYISEIMDYLSFATDERPFPLGKELPTDSD
ncbi:DUF4389 domain-containing protein [Kordiimonas lipolytica]|uniref:DUF4389 domain-containing protein n=1 Tax=Kordiimonas lipolytica TaxID=1662421 RepID=A0ABV8UAW5_9PROT|nr:DUF4389 domain-containing protein [Kordiimonas lipolytica]